MCLPLSPSSPLGLTRVLAFRVPAFCPCTSGFTDGGVAMKARTLKRLHFLLVAAYFGGCVLAWPHLPERMPLHFDFLGRVTAWAPTSTAMWFLVPVLATAVVLFLYAAASVPEAWQLSREDLRQFRALAPAAQARITESAHRSTALVLILLTLTLIGLQLGIYSTAVRGLNRMPWYAEVSILSPIVLVLFLSFRDRSKLRTEIQAAYATAEVQATAPEERAST